MNWKGIWGGLLGLGLALAGPTDNSLVVGTSQEPRVLMGDFVGAISNQAIKVEMEKFLHAPFIEINRDLERVAVVATEVPTEQNKRLRFVDIGKGKRRLEMDLTIRKEAVWSDGVPITTDDVSFYYQVGKTKGVPVSSPDFWDRVGLRVKDKQNFTVTLEPAYFYDQDFDPLGYAPAHIMGAEWEKTRAAAAGRDAAAAAEIYRNFFQQFSSPQALNNKKMVFSGPFVVTRWTPGSSVEMARNPRFLITPPGGADKYIQKVTYRIIQNTNSLLVAILGGGIDATSSVSLSFDQGRSPQLARRAGNTFELWFVETPFFEHLEVNNFLTSPRTRELGLDDKRTRQALTLAMNREGMMKAFFDGLLPVAHTWVSPRNPMYNPNTVKYDYNPQKARDLLAQLGWKPGSDGILQRTIDGKTVRFEVEWVTTAGNQVRERMQQFLGENLRQVGVAVKFNNAPSAVVLSAAYRSRAQDGTWSGFLHFAYSMGSADDGVRSACRDDDGALVFAPTKENGYRGTNYGGWCNADFDKLRSQAVTEFDPAKRKAIFARMQDIWADEVQSIPIYFQADPRVFRKGLLNWVSSTFASSGYPAIEPWLIGWEQRGARKIYDQAKYALSIK
jgi:peptide/nickel transport system substrate-binding protein